MPVAHAPGLRGTFRHLYTGRDRKGSTVVPEGKRQRRTRPGLRILVKVDQDKRTITVTLENGKKQDLMIEDDTKFVGPRDGVSTYKLKHDRLKPGAEITFVMGFGKAVNEIRLPVRKGAKDGDKQAPDKKDKDKTRQQRWSIPAVVVAV